MKQFDESKIDEEIGDEYEDGYEEYSDIEDDEDDVTTGKIEKVMIAVASCIVLALALVIGGFFYYNRSNSIKDVESYVADNGIVYNEELAGVGSAINGIDIIGGTGIQNAVNARKSSLNSGDVVVDVDEKDEDYNETEYDNEIEVSLETVSVVKDLKIKLINKKNGKLIANVPFSLTVITPSGKTETWTDTDKDGIIYYSEIEAGTYKIHIDELDKSKYAAYTLPSDISSVVKSQIDYEKVAVADEIKDASEVDESKEDTARDGADSGNSTLTNTVAFVESTKTAKYTAISNNDTVEYPFVIASYVYGNAYSGLVAGDVTNPTQDTDTGTNTDGNNDVSEQATGSITPTSSSLSLVNGDIAVTPVTISVSGTSAYTVSASSSNEGVATATFDSSKNELTVSGKSAGTATITLTLVNSVDGTTLATCGVETTVSAPAVSIVIPKTSVAILAGKQTSMDVTLANITASDITVSSSAEGTAKGSIDANGKLTINGVTAGTATITLSSKNDANIKASISVTVYDGSSKMTAIVNGTSRQLYVLQADGTYREAVNSDYTGSQTFYYESGYTYTGWQTVDGKTYYYQADGKAVTGEQVISGALYNFDSTGALVTGSGVLGIDVSKWNGNIDWAKVKAAGVSYVIIRIGYRGSTQGGLIDDSNFKKNIQGATAAGLKVGVYFVTQAINDAEAVYEASMVLDRIAGYTISYPVFLDVESSGGGRGDKIDVATRTSVCLTFCRTIQKAGYTAGIYANKSWLTSKINTSELSSYKIWCAQYYTSCTYAGTYHMWQYTDSGKIDGISGNVDLNISYLGY